MALACLALTLPACVSSSSERFHREEAYTRCYTAPHSQKEQCIAAHIAAMEAEERSSETSKGTKP
jgi:hypothetical protein